MKNWWEENEEFDLDGKREDPFEAKMNEDDKNFEEVFDSSFDEMPLRQQIETAYDYYEKPKSEKTDQIAESNCVMTFDGQNLGLFKNGRLQDHLDGQSGQDGFQSSGYQNVKDKGPIPEGRYYVNQKERQTITPWDAGWGTLAPMLKKINPSARGGKWQGGPVAWGTRRAWLRPDKKAPRRHRAALHHQGLQR